jgi:hypothetical protein
MDRDDAMLERKKIKYETNFKQSKLSINIVTIIMCSGWCSMGICCVRYWCGCREMEQGRWERKRRGERESGRGRCVC